VAKNGSSSKGSETFTIDRTTLVQNILPPGGEQLMQEISSSLGIDLLDPKGWSKEQVINAKKLASELDEKMMMMQELMPAVMKFLEFQVSVAEFHAEVMVETYKAKYQIDKAKAKAFVAYYSYMRKAAQLEKRVQATQKHIDAAYQHFESVQDARSNAILAGLNQQARLGEQGIQHTQQMKERRNDIRAQNSQRRRELREELRVGHLQGNNN
jgi:DNA anti-recombination protein RmuC